MVQKLTDQEISRLLLKEGVEATTKRVRTWRHRLGIPTLPRWERVEAPSIEGNLKSILVGSMLGDGRIARREQSSYYEERHSPSQKAYLLWKASQWGCWESDLNSADTVREGKTYTSWIFRTPAHPCLNYWRDLFYDSRRKGWKRLVPEIVDHVDSKALAIWYLDDGSVGWWPDITLGASPDSLKVAFAILEKFGISPRWEAKKGVTGVLHMEREEAAERFLSLVTPHIPSCMAYKASGFGFQGLHYQIRKKCSKDNLERLRGKGMSSSEIAVELDVGETTVRRWMKRWGLNG